MPSFSRVDRAVGAIPMFWAGCFRVGPSAVPLVPDGRVGLMKPSRGPCSLPCCNPAFPWIRYAGMSADLRPVGPWAVLLSVWG